MDPSYSSGAKGKKDVEAEDKAMKGMGAGDKGSKAMGAGDKPGDKGMKAGEKAMGDKGSKGNK